MYLWFRPHRKQPTYLFLRFDQDSLENMPPETRYPVWLRVGAIFGRKQQWGRQCSRCIGQVQLVDPRTSNSARPLPTASSRRAAATLSLTVFSAKLLKRVGRKTSSASRPVDRAESTPLQGKEVATTQERQADYSFEGTLSLHRLRKFVSSVTGPSEQGKWIVERGSRQEGPSLLRPST